ncbi:8-oxoguanine DNA glycosylase [Kosmotoga arenicorallina S304]|uniref:DNA-(apurinic or apyrimidinic site) lyase n=1 Tax=Kosmotoga arenicorallina S304 TaxID=1453497 RepID=A0A182C827_9BACT|nr:DNA glycosylase [Kosmotoga arenicorallina]OAA31924.1 8-oxoguanine DNA glycosylase [Kosmotoga arenicorallina S304]
MVKLEIRAPEIFDLDATLDCGQTFRWTKEDDCWTGVVRDTALILKQEGKIVKVIASADTLLGEDLDVGLKDYLGFEDPLEEILAELEKLSKSLPEPARSISLKSIEEGRGLRILRQNPFEMTVEYIISTRNNIPTIRRMANALSALFPENRISLNGKMFYAFPDLVQLKKLSINQLKELKLAFRVPWLYELFQNTNSEEFFVQLENLSLNEKLEALMKRKGIGYKVASCVTLFGYAELNSFPVDVWIKRVMKDLFNIEGSTKKVMEYGMEKFYPYAGYYQELLFRYYRRKFGRGKR